MKWIIARHGNTFDKGDCVLRVGGRTDLPLSRSGIAQSIQLGQRLSEQYVQIDHCWVSDLKRTQQTACHIRDQFKQDFLIECRSELNEIDYGVDEGQPESKVVERLGQKALLDWETKAIVPPGWQVSTAQIEQHWRFLAEQILTMKVETMLTVTSNGVARFAKVLLNQSDRARQHTKNKLNTGHFALLDYDGQDWHWVNWNVLY